MSKDGRETKRIERIRSSDEDDVRSAKNSDSGKTNSEEEKAISSIRIRSVSVAARGERTFSGRKKRFRESDGRIRKNKSRRRIRSDSGEERENSNETGAETRDRAEDSDERRRERERNREEKETKKRKRFERDRRKFRFFEFRERKIFDSTFETKIERFETNVRDADRREANKIRFFFRGRRIRGRRSIRRRERKTRRDSISKDGKETEGNRKRREEREKFLVETTREFEIDRIRGGDDVSGRKKKEDSFERNARGASRTDRFEESVRTRTIREREFARSDRSIDRKPNENESRKEENDSRDCEKKERERTDEIRERKRRSRTIEDFERDDEIESEKRLVFRTRGETFRRKETCFSNERSSTTKAGGRTSEKSARERSRRRFSEESENRTGIERVENGRFSIEEFGIRGRSAPRVGIRAKFERRSSSRVRASAIRKTRNEKFERRRDSRDEERGTSPSEADSATRSSRIEFSIFRDCFRDRREHDSPPTRRERIESGFAREKRFDNGRDREARFFEFSAKNARRIRKSRTDRDRGASEKTTKKKRRSREDGGDSRANSRSDDSRRDRPEKKKRRDRRSKNDPFSNKRNFQREDDFFDDFPDDDVSG
ncbi:hypothetical protein HNY73_000083 [Argiope bruennichi]|uniref:Uncharacterized protein n=1 Tax=Argiope bruennichi TaxID=94029 RepID=A0A8T0FZB0_ARGBR|nr:hypothetical protein HNY73_000083 [Argiope bruennichi]